MHCATLPAQLEVCRRWQALIALTLLWVGKCLSLMASLFHTKRKDFFLLQLAAGFLRKETASPQEGAPPFPSLDSLLLLNYSQFYFSYLWIQG